MSYRCIREPSAAAGGLGVVRYHLFWSGPDPQPVADLAQGIARSLGTHSVTSLLVLTFSGLSPTKRKWQVSLLRRAQWHVEETDDLALAVARGRPTSAALADIASLGPPEPTPSFLIGDVSAAALPYFGLADRALTDEGRAYQVCSPDLVNWLHERGLALLLPGLGAHDAAGAVLLLPEALASRLVAVDPEFADAPAIQDGQHWWDWPPDRLPDADRDGQRS